MTNGNVLLEFRTTDTIGQLFQKLGMVNEPLFLIAVDADGQPFPAAAQGRRMQEIPNGTPSAPVTKIVHLEHASWTVYEYNPRRSRTRVGGTTWDG